MKSRTELLLAAETTMVILQEKQNNYDSKRKAVQDDPINTDLFIREILSIAKLNGKIEALMWAAGEN